MPNKFDALITNDENSQTFTKLMLFANQQIPHIAGLLQAQPRLLPSNMRNFFKQYCQEQSLKQIEKNIEWLKRILINVVNNSELLENFEKDHILKALLNNPFYQVNQDNIKNLQTLKVVLSFLFFKHMAKLCACPINLLTIKQHGLWFAGLFIKLHSLSNKYAELKDVNIGHEPQAFISWYKGVYHAVPARLLDQPTVRKIKPRNSSI